MIASLQLNISKIIACGLDVFQSVSHEARIRTQVLHEICAEEEMMRSKMKQLWKEGDTTPLDY